MNRSGPYHYFVSFTCTDAADSVPLLRDRGPGARAADAARHVSRSVHQLFRSPRAPDLRQSVPAGPAQRQRPEIDAADARPAQRPRFLSRPAALHHAFDVGGAPVLAAAARADSRAPRHLGDRRHRPAEAGPRLGRRAAAVLRRRGQGRQLPDCGVDGVDRRRVGVADVVGAVPAQSWTEDDERRARARIPRVAFREKWRIAVAHVRTVLPPASPWRPSSPMPAMGTSPLPRGARTPRRGVCGGGAVSRRRPPDGHDPRESLAAIANSLAPSAWHRIRWGRGTKGPLEARFAAVRVRIREESQRALAVVSGIARRWRAAVPTSAICRRPRR